MKTPAIFTVLLAGLALASPLGETERLNEAAEAPRTQKRCALKHCNDCYANDPPNDATNPEAALG